MFYLGHFLQLTTFGESHGPAIGGILTGFPAGVAVEVEQIQKALDRRRPGQSKLVTQRKESDTVQLLSGIFEGISTGMPIGFLIPNENTRSADYAHLQDAPRPSHADYTWQQKFRHRDHRGGGRSSARETANWVVGGELAGLLLPPEVKVTAYVSQVGPVSLKDLPTDFSQIENNPVRCPDLNTAAEMEAEILRTKKRGETVGGVVTCQITGLPVGLGEPVFAKLQAALAQAMLSINACKGFEYGSGFSGAAMYGSQHNDQFNPDFSTHTNHSGGIQGGVSNGMAVDFRVAFKPVATLLQPQESYDFSGKPIQLEGRGRHDACVVPRAVPVVEALAKFVLADLFLINKIRKI